jgi:uncharacterized OB-fold protein
MPEDVQVLRCPACGALDPGPRLLCANCGSPGLLAHKVSGAGTVASWTVIHRPPARFRGDGPYAVAVVDLSAGVRVTGRLSRIPEDGLLPGAAVVAVDQSQQVIVFEEVVA